MTQYDMAQYSLVLVTVPSQQEARAIASALVRSQLAATITFTQVYSTYTWEGEVFTEEEWQLIIKTDLTVFETLEAKIRELHSYEVPEIIAIPIVAGSQPYLNWISENVMAEG